MARNDADLDEWRECPDCGTPLEAVFGRVSGVSFVRYRCSTHGFNALMEFLT
jgi:uncharacterized protein (UPF0212 family)